ncbi:hypothetical protein P7C65_07s1g10150 [Encephalitozoon intestinalis]
MPEKVEKKDYNYHSSKLEDLLLRLPSENKGERINLEGCILQALEILFGKSTDYLILGLKACKAHKLGLFHKESIKDFMKKNELVNGYVGSFFAWLVDFFPISFVEILFEEEATIFKHYTKVLMKLYKSPKVTESRLATERQDFNTLSCITKPKIAGLIRYPGVVTYLTKNLMYMNEEERLFLIKRYLKREDFEYYLNTLIDRSQTPEKYRADLDEYLKNGILEDRSGKYSVFMRVYNFIKKNNHKTIEDVGVVERVFDGYSVEEFLQSDIGLIFVTQTIEYIGIYSGSVQKCRDIISRALKSDIPRDISKTLWNTLITNRRVFLECIEKFKIFEDEDLARILIYRRSTSKEEGPSIYKSISYGDGIYRKEAVEYVVESFSTQEITNVMLKQDSDERSFLLECIYRKALLGEFDFRIFEIEDEVWVEKTYDEIFKTLSHNIYDSLVEKRPELLFDYCFRHRDLRRKYFEEIDKENCTIEEGICIHKILRHESKMLKSLKSNKSYAEAVYGDTNEGNEIYMMSTLMDPIPSSNIVEFIYLLTLIRPEDAKYYMCEYFEEICEQATNCLKEESSFDSTDYSKVLSLGDLSLMYLVPFHQMIETMFSVHLRNRYLVYTIMDSLLESIVGGVQNLRLIILKSMDSNSVTSHHIVKYIDTLTPLLHNSNIQICNESRRLLMEIPIITPELVCLKSQMVQSIIDKMYAKSFFKSIRRQQFNHYLCFNTLNMLVQTLTMHIKELKEDVFPILSSLEFIAHPQDLKLVFPVIFESLSSFVIENAFYLDECCSVVASLMKFGGDISFDRLIDNMGLSLRVNKFLVRCLKASNNEIAESVINRIIRKGSGDVDIREDTGEGSLYVEPFFLAYAPELPIFKEYLPIFKPLLKRLFLSSDTMKQEIASKAFESMDILEFLLTCCIIGQWKTRLLCIELFDKKGGEDSRVLAMLFILRNDTHSALRKKALDIWKSKVVNTNSALKDIYRTILGSLGYKESSSPFRDSIMGALSDLITKYSGYVEKYLEDAMNEEHVGSNDNSISNPLGLNKCEEGLKIISKKEVLEVILMECVKSGKYMNQALDFSIQNSSTDIFRLLLQIPSYREKVIEIVGNRIDDLVMSDLFTGDSHLGIDLFKMTGKTSLFKFLKNSDKMSLLESMLIEKEPNTAHIKKLLKCMKPSEKLEKCLLVSDPLYTSTFYGSGEKMDDQGHQRELFIRAFNTLNYQELKPLIIPDYLNLLLDVSYKNVNDSQSLIKILCTTNSLRALERLNYVVSDMEIEDSLFVLSGHLLRNYLSYEKREAVLPSLNLLYKRYSAKLGVFGLMIRRLLDDSGYL